MSGGGEGKALLVFLGALKHRQKPKVLDRAVGFLFQWQTVAFPKHQTV
tara:strand:- start:225 stop:368 length:144 start_codon:yes stop_codon:yes gene_type:complete